MVRMEVYCSIYKLDRVSGQRDSGPADCTPTGARNRLCESCYRYPEAQPSKPADMKVARVMITSLVIHATTMTGSPQHVIHPACTLTKSIAVYTHGVKPTSCRYRISPVNPGSSLGARLCSTAGYRTAVESSLSCSSYAAIKGKEPLSTRRRAKFVWPSIVSASSSVPKALTKIGPPLTLWKGVSKEN